jgi:hypothetical protein
LSRDLETAERERDSLGRLLPNDGKQGKAQTLADAGISTSTANRYGQLAGGKEKQAQDGSASGGGRPAWSTTGQRKAGATARAFDPTTRPLTLAGEPEPAAAGTEIRSLKCGGFDSK